MQLFIHIVLGDWWSVDPRSASALLSYCNHTLHYCVYREIIASATAEHWNERTHHFLLIALVFKQQGQYIREPNWHWADRAVSVPEFRPISRFSTPPAGCSSVNIWGNNFTSHGHLCTWGRTENQRAQRKKKYDRLSEKVRTTAASEVYWTT